MQFATGSPISEIGIRLIRSNVTMDFQGVSNAAAAPGETDRTRWTARIAPVGLLCKGIKITQRLIAPQQELERIIKIDMNADLGWTVGLTLTFQQTLCMMTVGRRGCREWTWFRSACNGQVPCTFPQMSIKLAVVTRAGVNRHRLIALSLYLYFTTLWNLNKALWIVALWNAPRSGFAAIIIDYWNRFIKGLQLLDVWSPLRACNLLEVALRIQVIYATETHAIVQ